MNELLNFWINLLALSAANIGLLFVAYELYRARKAEVRQFQFDTFRMFAIDLRRDRIIISELLLESDEEILATVRSDLEKFHACKNILDF